MFFNLKRSKLRGRRVVVCCPCRQVDSGVYVYSWYIREKKNGEKKNARISFSVKLLEYGNFSASN